MRKIRKNTVIAVVLAMLAGAGGGYLLYNHVKKANSLRAAVDSLVLEADEELLNIEYGDDFDIQSFIKSHTGEMEIEGDVDPMTVGDVPVTVTLSTYDQYEQKAEKEFSFTAHVQDTKKPEITLKSESITVYTDDDFNPADNVESVKDPVDGDLKQAEEPDKGIWTVETDCDVSEPGEYTVTVTAQDLNENITEVKYTVTVEERPVIDFDPVKAYSSDYPYYIRINRALNVVTVYTTDENGYYSVPFKAMVCSTGDATPLGSYNTTAQYRWLSLFGGVYGQYATRIVGHILFHSVPYFSQDPSDLEYEEYNKLGTAASMGCIRLCVEDVLWIYNNCPVGTTVELYDDYNYPGPLGKPTPLTIDINDSRRGWDPTDPDPNNPWN